MAKILDPQREEYRSWLAKKRGLEKNRMRAANVLICEYCNAPIGPDTLVSDLRGHRACPPCVKKHG
jgi:hypothetical protein